MSRRKKIVHYYFVYPLAIIVSILFIFIGFASFFLLNIHNYQTTVKKMLSSATGYNINFSQIRGSFNLRLQPTVNIDNITVSDKVSKHQFLHINNLKLSASYRSFSLGTIVLSQIKLDGMDLTIKYDNDSNLIANDEVLANFKIKQKSSFDIEKFLLQLHEFDISNLNLTFINQMYKLNPVNLQQTTFSFINSIGKRHSATLKTILGKSDLNVELKFQAPSISDIGNWHSGELILSDTDRENHNINLKASLSDGNLEYMDMKFNSSMHQFFTFNNPIKGKSDLVGEIQVDKGSNGVYNVKGTDISINTLTGSILNHASLFGSYSLNKGGVVNLSKVDLSGITSLKLHQFSDKVTLGGDIESISFSWGGHLLRPDNILLKANFRNIMLDSRESSIPSINNINGDLALKKESGSVNISLKDGKFSYPQQLNKPILISRLSNTTNWSIESNAKVLFKWQNSTFQTKDFTLTTSGQYTTESNIIDTVAKMNRIDIVNIPDYLPKSNSAISSFIKSEMPTGYLDTLNLAIRGDVNKIPFSHGGGHLTFSENFNDVTLRFSPVWGAITHIGGKLTADNQAVSVNIITGKLNNFTVSKTSYVVPEALADNPLLTMYGFASGSTSDFIDYIKTTPLKSRLEDAPKEFKGNSEVSIKLDLPVATPDKLKLSGKWNFMHNDLDFGTQIPYISDFNGVLNFTDKGITSSRLHGVALGSNLELSVVDAENFELYSPDLDYLALQKFMGFTHNDLFFGRAATKVDYDVTNAHLTVSSNLQGVKIISPAPLNKNESEIKQLTLNFNQNIKQLNINYADTLFALINMNQDMHFKSGKVSIGTPDLNIKYNNNYPLTINAKLNNLHIIDWVDFFKKISASDSVGTTNTSSSISYPIQVQLKTDAVWINDYNIDGGRVDMSVNPNKIIAQINMPDIYGDMIYQNNKVWLNLDKLLLSSTNLTSMEGPKTKMLASTKSHTKVPDMMVRIKNLYVQNHYLGELNALVLQRNKAIYIESASLNNASSKTIFRVINHDIGESREYTELRLRTQIKDYGATISKLNIGDNLKAGNGVFDMGLKWRGGFTDFGIKKTLGYGQLNIKNGEFTHVNPGLFGTLLGVVSLNTFTNMRGLNLNTFFGKGFAFNSWDMKVDIIFDQAKVEQLKLVSNAASISSFGTIDLNDNTVDSYLTVQPRLGAAVATTAGVVTLNPFIGAFVYAGEALIGNPVNKALGLSYHITGKVSDPEIVKFDLSDQIQQNFLSTTNILSHPASIFDVQVNK